MVRHDPIPRRLNDSHKLTRMPLRHVIRDEKRHIMTERLGNTRAGHRTQQNHGEVLDIITCFLIREEYGLHLLLGPTVLVRKLAYMIQIQFPDKPTGP